MKHKISIAFLLMSIIMALGAFSLTSCSNDDDVDNDAYQGYVDQIIEVNNPEEGAPKYGFWIIVTKSPNNEIRYMPVEKDNLLVYIDDVAALNFKENQRLSFRILSAEKMDMYVDVLTCTDWKCKIEILKLY